MKSLFQLAIVAAAALIAPFAANAANNAEEPATLISSAEVVVVPAQTSEVLIKLANSNCFVIGSAKADLSSERMYVSADKLSCMASGKFVERSVKGYVVDLNGTNGLPMKLATRERGSQDNALYGLVDAGVKATFVFTEQ